LILKFSSFSLLGRPKIFQSIRLHEGPIVVGISTALNSLLDPRIRHE
jgi:hypothetical protein